MNLLEVQSSVREQESISRRLSDEFIQVWQTTHPSVQHVFRDVGVNPPAHPTELWTKGNYTPSEARTPEMVEALAESDRLIEEVLWADCLVMGVPMYNFSVPSNFKAYIDNIVRVDRTFAFDRTNFTFQGLAKDKKALVILPSAANYVPGTPMAEMDFCEPYLRSLLNFIGIDNVTVITVPNQFLPDEQKEEIERARTKLMTLAATW